LPRTPCSALRPPALGRGVFGISDREPDLLGVTTYLTDVCQMSSFGSRVRACVKVILGDVLRPLHHDSTSIQHRPTASCGSPGRKPRRSWASPRAASATSFRGGTFTPGRGADTARRCVVRKFNGSRMRAASRLHAANQRFRLNPDIRRTAATGSPHSRSPGFWAGAGCGWTSTPCAGTFPTRWGRRVGGPTGPI